MKKTCSARPADWPIRDYFRTLAENAAATIGWLGTHGVSFDTPIYYLSAGPPRIQPIGGGRAIIDRLAESAGKAGIKLRYKSPVTRLKMGEGGVSGVEVRSSGRAVTALDADAVILASGGFQGDATMTRKHFGAARRDAEADLAGNAFRDR